MENIILQKTSSLLSNCDIIAFDQFMPKVIKISENKDEVKSINTSDIND